MSLSCRYTIGYSFFINNAKLRNSIRFCKEIDCNVVIMRGTMRIVSFLTPVCQMCPLLAMGLVSV